MSPINLACWKHDSTVGSNSLYRRRTLELGLTGEPKNRLRRIINRNNCKELMIGIGLMNH